MSEERNYSWYCKLMIRGLREDMETLTQFKRTCPEIYQRYRKQYLQETAKSAGCVTESDYWWRR